MLDTHQQRMAEIDGFGGGGGRQQTFYVSIKMWLEICCSKRRVAKHRPSDNAIIKKRSYFNGEFMNEICAVFGEANIKRTKTKREINEKQNAPTTTTIKFILQNRIFSKAKVKNNGEQQ